MSQNVFNMVSDFHEKADAYIGEVNQLHASMDLDTVILRQRLILEELGELAIAIHGRDLEMIADGLCDLLYVVAGTAVSLGVPVDDPNQWPSPTSPRIAAQFCEDPTHVLAQLTVDVSGLLSSLVSDDPGILRHYLNHCFRTIGRFAVCYNIDLMACFTEVHRSNMSKTLGGASGGKKYGSTNPKGPGYSPPNLRPILGLPPSEPPVLRIEETSYQFVERFFGMPVFVLKACDKITDQLVGSWIYRANQLDVNPEKVARAAAHRFKIQQWQNENPDKVKVPD